MVVVMMVVVLVRRVRSGNDRRADPGAGVEGRGRSSDRWQEDGLIALQVGPARSKVVGSEVDLTAAVDRRLTKGCKTFKN